MSTLLEVMASKVERIEVGESSLVINNVLRGFETLPARLR